MPFPPGTILTRATPLPATDDGPNPLNVLKVIGPSPVRPAENPVEAWQSKDGDHVLVSPEEVFAAVQIAPEIVLRDEYDAEYPVDEEPVTPQAKVAAQRAALESPEVIFARSARESATATKRSAKTAAKS